MVHSAGTVCLRPPGRRRVEVGLEAEVVVVVVVVG